MSPRTLFLDAGGVLVLPNYALVAGAFARRGVPADAAALTRAHYVAAHRLDEPEHFTRSNDDSRWAVFLGLVLREAGVRASDAVLRDALDELKDYHDRENLWEHVPDGVPAALDALAAAGFRLVVVSNANGTVRAKLERIGLGARFEHILDSFEEGVEKPDPRFFRIALDRSGADPSTTLHVGDLYHVDVVGARAAGLRAVLLDPLGLHAYRDCDRVESLSALAERLERGLL